MGGPLHILQGYNEQSGHLLASPNSIAVYAGDNTAPAMHSLL